MLPPNDRIAQVETNFDQFRAESRKAYGELAAKIRVAETISETLIEQIGLLKAIMEYRFDRINMRLDAQDSHLMYLHE